MQPPAAALMYCDYYRCKLDSKWCLEYQARARGTAQKGPNPVNPSVLGHWAIKYKPCLDCAQGRKIKKKGGDNSDVEALKQEAAQKREKKFCKFCTTWKFTSPDRDRSDFYTNGQGNFSPECKDCTKKRVLAARKAKQDKRRQEAADQQPFIVAQEQTLVEVPPEVVLGQCGTEPEPELTPTARTCQEFPLEIFVEPPVDFGADPEKSTKTCGRCQQEKSLDDFQRDRNRVDGHDPICKACRSLEKKQWRLRRQLEGGGKTDKVLTITIPGPVYSALYQDACRELRSVENQAAWLLREWATGDAHAD